MSKKDRPNSTYWRNKADEIFMKQFRGEPCAVCGSEQGTVGHHVVGKGRCKALRYDTGNIIVLCAKHHTMGNDMAPHATNQMAVERFLEWFKTENKMQHWYCKEMEHVERRYTYKQAFENMKKGIDAWL